MVIIMFMLCGRLCPGVDYKHIPFTFFQLVFHIKSNKWRWWWWWCISAAIYTKFPIFVLPFVLGFYVFEQDGYQMKVAFVSSRFENLLEDVVFLDGIQLKTQNTTFQSFMDDDKTVPQYRYYSSHRPHKVDKGGREGWFFSQITTLKTVPSDKKSNCRTCAEGCQKPINYKMWLS